MTNSILLVDDEPFMLRGLRYVFEGAGFDVHEARDGTEALEQARAVKPEICLLDIMIPGATGYEVCESIKADPSLKETKVVLVTAVNREAAMARGQRSGADGLVSKPFSPKALVSRIKRVLANQATTQGGAG